MKVKFIFKQNVFKYDFKGAIDAKNNIQLLCSTMLDESLGDAIHRYAKVNDIILDTYGQKCLDASYSSLIKQLSAVSWNDSAAVGGIKREIKYN